MTKNRVFTYLLFGAGLLIFFNGCKTPRQTAAVALTKMRKEERIQSIQHQALPFNTLSASLRFSIKSEIKKNTTSANAQLRIIKDKAIQLSLRVPFIGIELARVSLTPEQIIFIDRNSRLYASESVQTVQKMASFNFDFYSLQALFTNQLFIAGKSSVTIDDYNVFNWSENDYLSLLNNTDSQGIHYNFISDFTNRIIQTEIYKNKKDINLNCLYRDFGPASNNSSFPMRMTVELTVPDDLITLNMTFNNVDIDTRFDIDTAIPDRFQKVEIEQIIKLIQSF